jgi:hypothetical protein
MSGLNGDKSRFHRQRKKKIALRALNQVRFQHGASQPRAEDKPASPSSGSPKGDKEKSRNQVSA